jgi:hypothetical protein
MQQLGCTPRTGGRDCCARRVTESQRSGHNRPNLLSSLRLFFAHSMIRHIFVLGAADTGGAKYRDGLSLASWQVQVFTTDRSNFSMGASLTPVTS